jgi:hypothetical protein
MLPAERTAVTIELTEDMTWSDDAAAAGGGVPPPNDATASWGRVRFEPIAETVSGCGYDEALTR